jgi:hypothetical protein
MITAAIVGIVMVSTGVLTQQEARDCLQWDLYITIACAFGIGAAMTNSGVAGGIATFLVNIGQGLGIGGEWREWGASVDLVLCSSGFDDATSSVVRSISDLSLSAPLLQLPECTGLSTLPATC